MDQHTNNPNDDLNEPQPPQAPTPFGEDPQPATPSPEPVPTPEPAPQQAPPVNEQPPGQGYSPPPEQKPASAPTQDEKMWAMFCHLAALAMYLPIPFGNILGPLIVWLIKKDEFPFVEDQGRESLNFQISIGIYFLACIPLIFVVIGIPLIIGLGIFNLVMIIISSISANKGETYRYPLNLRLIK
jgi:uncharacterized Tic20 family protein